MTSSCARMFGSRTSTSNWLSESGVYQPICFTICQMSLYVHVIEHSLVIMILMHVWVRGGNLDMSRVRLLSLTSTILGKNIGNERKHRISDFFSANWLRLCSLDLNKALTTIRQPTCMMLVISCALYSMIYARDVLYFLILLLCHQINGFIGGATFRYHVRPYPSGLLHWHWGNHKIAPVPVQWPWRMWIKTGPVTVTS